MGAFTKLDLDRLIASGCSTCGDKRLAFRSYVDARIPMMAGEPTARLSWAYDGEAFCDGIFEVTCKGCTAELFSSRICTRCNREDGLATALTTPNAMEVPEGCPTCKREEIVFFGFVPAETSYEGKRAEKARTDVDLYDEGFHGFQAWCKSCGVFNQVKHQCPLCTAPGPLRERPR